MAGVALKRVVLRRSFFKGSYSWMVSNLDGHSMRETREGFFNGGMLTSQSPRRIQSARVIRGNND